MDPSRMASARIPTTGGSVQATGADGTVYTLTIPPDALLSHTTITMTPITGVSGLDASSDRILGVQLEPDGLRFFSFATLTFSPPEGANHQAFAFSYHGTGAELHRVPLTPDQTFWSSSCSTLAASSLYRFRGPPKAASWLRRRRA